MNKLISIIDYIRVPYRTSTLQCPITEIALSDGELERIFNSATGILHIYAHNPNNTSETVPLNKDNYMLTNDELFNIINKSITPEIVTETDANTGIEITKEYSSEPDPEFGMPIGIDSSDIPETTEEMKVEVVAPLVDTIKEITEINTAIAEDSEAITKNEEIKTNEVTEETKVEPSVEDIAAVFNKKTPASAKKKVTKPTTSKKKN